MALPTASTYGYGYLYTYTSHPNVGCDCLREWLPVLAREARKRGILGPTETLRVIQATGGADASAGTHSRGGAYDLAMPDAPRWHDASRRDYRVLGPKTKALIYLGREMGAPNWGRFDVDGRWDGDGWENNEHIHGVLNGCPHLHWTAQRQISEYLRGEDGLVGSGRDPHPRPPFLRTWRQGIAWANSTSTPTTSPTRDWFDMATKAELQAIVRAEVERLLEVRYPDGGPKVGEWLAGSGGKLDRINQKLSDLVGDTWGAEFPVPGVPEAGTVEAQHWLVGAGGKLDEVNRKLADIAAALAEIKAQR